MKNWRNWKMGAAVLWKREEDTEGKEGVLIYTDDDYGLVLAGENLLWLDDLPQDNFILIDNDCRRF